MKNTDKNTPKPIERLGVPPQRSRTISVQDATQRASAWRSLLGSIPAASTGADNPAPGIPPQLVFRAVNINMADINALQAAHPDATSIRIYLGIPDDGNDYYITGMVVPVNAQNVDLLYQTDDPNLSEEFMLADATSSSVYDFTQPCPTLCNTGSPLFDDKNNPSTYLRKTGNA